jgi:hypothetical protein
LAHIVDGDLTTFDYPPSSTSTYAVVALEVSGPCQQSPLGHVGVPLVLEIFDSQLLLALPTGGTDIVFRFITEYIVA